MFGVKSGRLEIDGTTMDYACFGNGKKTLVMIAGLSLKDVRGSEWSLAYIYRIFSEEYTVYVIDKKNDIPEEYTVKDIADDIALAIKKLKIEKADVIGVSHGGMIAQYLAINNPELVNKLVLAVTMSKSNETVKKVVGDWVGMSKNNDYKSIVADMMQKMYSESYLKKYKWLLPVLKNFAKPKSPQRFIRLAESCLTCSSYEQLNSIKCPVFVIGGKQDKIVTGEASYEIARKLGCDIYMYDNLGHSAYDEEKILIKKFWIFWKNSFVK